MQIEGHHRHWQVATEAELEAVLRFRDSVGGAQFWLSADDEDFPLLAMRITGDVGDVHYFPAEGDPGSRALATLEGLDTDQTVLLRYEGADPASGEMTPRRFLLPFATLVNVARSFLQVQSLPTSVAWFEL
jgi:hypothetical protein